MVTTDATANIDNLQLTARDFELLRGLVYEMTGINLISGKRAMLESRLRRRVRATGLSDFGEYYRYVVAQPPDSPELRAMINAVTTNKTDFFREAHHFEFVANRLIPALTASARSGMSSRRLRVWHAGCSTGQEPYSLAITLLQSMPECRTWDIKLLASDIDTDVLQRASTGVYRSEDIADIPAEVRLKYFARQPGDDKNSVTISDAAREMIRFRRINLLEQPWPIRPDVKFDMIWCRNVVIYFDKPTQSTLFQRFADRLRPGGYLFIGHSESLLGLSDAFISLGGTVYQKI